MKNNDKLLVFFSFLVLFVFFIIFVIFVFFRSVFFKETPQTSVEYNQKSVEKIAKQRVSPVPFTTSDAAVKFKLIEQLNGGSGYIYRSSNVNLFYIKETDEIQAEITTPKIDMAKQEAVTWLKSQGMSQKGICGFPVIFILNVDLQKEMNNYVFDPLAPGC